MLEIARFPPIPHQQRFVAVLLLFQKYIDWPCSLQKENGLLYAPAHMEPTSAWGRFLVPWREVRSASWCHWWHLACPQAAVSPWTTHVQERPGGRDERCDL